MNKLKNTVKEIAKKVFIQRWNLPYIYKYICTDSNITISEFLNARVRNYVFMIAEHNNGGDLAQTVCIDEWLDTNYPDAITVNVGFTAQNPSILKLVCQTVRKQDRVFIQSGYNITDSGVDFMESNCFKSHEILLNELHDHQIVFFPQSVRYDDLAKWEGAKRLYASHPNIVFITRDLVSRKLAEPLLPKAKHLSYPDVVTTWIGKYDFGSPSKDILLCLRNDIAESALTDSERKEIENAIKQNYIVDSDDTDLHVPSKIYRKFRKREVLNKIKQFAQYKVIVTDRYHGSIFSLIAKRPVIVLKTADHKVKESIKWYPKEFSKYVYFIENPKDIEGIIKSLNEIMSNYPGPLNSNYFSEQIYKKLKDDIESC